MCYDLSSSCTWWHLAASLRLCMWARRRWSSLVLSFVKRMKMRRIILLFLVCKSKADSFNYTGIYRQQALLKTTWSTHSPFSCVDWLMSANSNVYAWISCVDWCCLQIQTYMLESFGLCRWADGLRHSTMLSPNEARKGGIDSLSITFLVKKWCMRMCGLGRRKGRCSSRISKRNISLKFNPI